MIQEAAESILSSGARAQINSALTAVPLEANPTSKMSTTSTTSTSTIDPTLLQTMHVMFQQYLPMLQQQQPQQVIQPPQNQYQQNRLFNSQQNSQNGPCSNGNQQQANRGNCIFCGQLDHYIQNCQTVQTYVSNR